MKNNGAVAAHSFLAGGGEMGGLIRSIDWSATALGSVEEWPRSLRTALSLVLNARFPMFLFWGPDLICFYNDAYRPSLGNDGKHPAAMGQPGEAVWPETWAVIKPLIDQVLAGGAATWSENQLIPIYRNNQLEDAYWTFSYSAVSNESEQPGGVLVTCLETTTAVKTFQHLQETRDQLYSAIAAAELATWDLDPATNRFLGNARLNEWFGLAPDDEVTLSSALASIADRDRQRVTDAIATALQATSGGVYDSTYTIVNARTGRERIVRAMGRAHFDDSGAAYRFVGTTQDVTEQLQAREQLNRAEQMAQMAVAGAGAGTFFIDLTNDSIVYSPTLAIVFTGGERTGLTRDLLLTYILPEDRPIREAAYRNAARTGKLNYEARTVWQDGSIHWLRVLGAYLYDTQGVATGFSGIAMDITAQRAVQQELERQVDERTRELSNANQTLVRTNHELEQFAYIASHDLQEPLRKIQSFADLLQTNRHDAQLADLYLNKIIKSAQRMASLIKAVLAYSRLANKDELFQPTDLNSILQQTLTDFELLIEQKGAAVRAGSLPTLSGIPLQLGQLFTNLIGNALKFTDKAPVIDITATPVSANDPQPPGLNPAFPYVRITVLDNGIGFDPHYADRIFALFQRLSSSKTYGGTGIGLALCRKIVENHGGVITADSVAGQGAAFHVFLPLGQSADGG